jgi:NhaA family Na+:H+ antiporter
MSGQPSLEQTTARQGPFQRFFQTESAGGALLLLCSVAALVIANSPLAETYADFWHTPIVLSVGSHAFTLSLHGWINDGLMTVFFLLVGLEIKRELVAGELASPRQAALPIAGAVGGMVVPALIYIGLTFDTPGARGWGIPMATDIAFALGTLALVAPGAPTGAKVFLAALAIVDDMGAVMVIALFYTSTVQWSALAVSAGILVALVLLNRLGVRRLMPYLLLGVGLWFFVHESGVHATVAGVLLAFTIPTRTRINARQFSTRARELLDEFDSTETGDLQVLTSKGQQETLFASFAAFVVMPLFAVANAGVPLTALPADMSVALAAGLGLAVGKPLGITLAAWLTVRAGLASLPHRVNWLTLHACAWLGGIGFTMSLFIATLAFSGTVLLDEAKVGVLAGSLVAGIVAVLVMRRAEHLPPPDEAAAA